MKSYLDYGAFTPIQAAACAALNGPQDIVERNRELYQKRRDVMVEASAAPAGTSPSPPASMFAWVPLPVRSHGQPRIRQAAAHPCRSRGRAGVGFGEEGEGFVRIAMVENEQRLRQAARNVKKMLAGA